MSIVALLLGRFGLPKWAQEAIVILAALGALWAALAWHNDKVYDRGIAAQQAADKAATANLMREAAVATQAAQDAANRAEESYREEIARNAAAAAARPLGPVRLCIDAHAGGRSVPETGAAVPGAPGASPATGRLPGVPRGDPSLRQERPGPDLEQLLGAWADAADKVSAELRESKSRQPEKKP